MNPLQMIMAALGQGGANNNPAGGGLSALGALAPQFMASPLGLLTATNAANNQTTQDKQTEQPQHTGEAANPQTKNIWQALGGGLNSLMSDPQDMMLMQLLMGQMK